jgi:rod shape-determining protein MreC
VKNIFLFIRSYFNFIVFVILQGLSIAILVNYNKTHQAVFAGVANEVTGKLNEQYNGVESYFSLQTNNKLLLEENARLKNMLAQNFQRPDISVLTFTDSLFTDTIGKQRKFVWLPAKVVGNSVSLQNNYVMLERGSLQGVKPEMAVTGPNGIVGIVTQVSENYSKVMSLLHRNSKVSCMLKKNNMAGSLEWDGKNPSYLTLKGIPKSAQIVKGDTVLTSTYSSIFPSHLMVGTVAEVMADPSSNFFTLKVKSATNFFSLQYAYLVQNTMWEEQKALATKPVKNQ